MTAADAGKPVFCEKPISLDRATSVSTLEAVERAGVQFQVGFHRRFDPDWVAVTERIQAGELGEVTFFRSSLRDMTPPNPAFLSGSDTITQLPHQGYLIRTQPNTNLQIGKLAEAVGLCVKAAKGELKREQAEDTVSAAPSPSGDKPKRRAPKRKPQSAAA